MRRKETETDRALKRPQLDVLERMLKDIRHGSITLIVRDGKIIQIDKTKKYRIKN